MSHIMHFRNLHGKEEIQKDARANKMLRNMEWYWQYRTEGQHLPDTTGKTNRLCVDFKEYIWMWLHFERILFWNVSCLESYRFKVHFLLIVWGSQVNLHMCLSVFIVYDPHCKCHRGNVVSKSFHSWMHKLMLKITIYMNRHFMGLSYK